VHKNIKKWTVAFIIGIISITLVGSSFVAIFHPGKEDPEKLKQESLQIEYDERLKRVEQLTEIAAENPENSKIQISLADAYFEKSRVTGQLNYQEYEQDLQNAVKLYQEVLSKEKDNEVMLKLATAAFMLEDTELADKTYNDLIAREPENVDALYGHGLLLFYHKQDYRQAEAKWREACRLTDDELMKSSLEEMIQIVQEIETETDQE